MTVMLSPRRLTQEDGMQKRTYSVSRQLQDPC